MQLQILLEGPREPAPGALVELLRDRVNKRLTATEMWKGLGHRGYSESPWASEPALERQVERTNERFRESRLATLIGQRLIPRAETAQIEAAASEHRTVLVQGQAGMGKSQVLLDFCERLTAAGTPHLVIRLDRVDPVSTPEELGSSLGLPASPPAVLAAAAGGRRSFLIIDQLDALSTTSGRNPEFLECRQDAAPRRDRGRNGHRSRLPDLRREPRCKVEAPRRAVGGAAEGDGGSAK